MSTTTNTVAAGGDTLSGRPARPASFLQPTIKEAA